MTHLTEQNWKEEFDGRFLGSDSCGDIKCKYPATIKDFIQSLITAVKEEERERISNNLNTIDKRKLRFEKDDIYMPYAEIYQSLTEEDVNNSK